MKPLLSLVLLVLCFAASPAFAQSADLVKYSPKTSKVLIGLNFEKLRPSPIYAEVFAFARQQPKLLSLLVFLEQELEINPEKDIEALVVSFPDAVANPAQAQANSTLSLAIQAPFDAAKLIEAAKKRFPDMKITGEGEQAIFVAGDFHFTLPAANRLVLATGDDSFVQETWAAVASPKESAVESADVKASMKEINLSRSLWMVGITRELQQPGPKMNRAGLTLDLVSGLKMDMIASMASAEDAKTAAKDFDTLKAQGANPMVSMLGAAPLANNLKASASKTTVKASTSMSKAEFATMVKQMKQIAAQGSQPVAPSQGTPETVPVEPKKGVKADFN